jgi:hypothetical protein
MSSFRYFFLKRFFACVLSISPLTAFALDENTVELDYPPASDEARIERSDTDPTYLMDDTPQRRRLQEKMKKKRSRAKLEKKQEASTEDSETQSKAETQTKEDAS